MTSSKLTIISLFLLLPMLISCGLFKKSEPAAIAIVTALPANVENIQVMENESNVETQVTQVKVFNQCDSSSSLGATIRSSQINSEELQRELVLKGGLEVEVASLSELVKGKIQGAVEAHFLSGNTRTESRYEEISIEVPPNTQQEYTILWQENRREGTVQYELDGSIHFVDYSYRLGIELVSTNVRDIPCPKIESVVAISEPTQTPYPTYTPFPTQTPYPTELPPTPAATNTSVPTATNIPAPVATSAPALPVPTSPPANTGLTMGQWYTSANISIGLTDVSFRTSPSVKIGLTVPVRNVSGGPISFQYGAYNFLVRDNNGNTYAAQGNSTQTVTLNAGETERFLTPDLCCQIFFPVNHADASITQLTFTVSDLSSVSLVEWIIPINH